MFKISKLLYAIVNQILPVPKQILDQVYQKYQQFIESQLKEQKIILNKQFSVIENQPIIIKFKKSNNSDSRYDYKNNENIFIFQCCNKLIDKDIIQHQLKHMLEYYYNKDDIFSLMHLSKLENLQFKTYITDFCNLITQIYKRLNRRFNVSLDTVIQKIVVDVVDNKTNINKYKNLLNGKLDIDCYEKCLTFLQLYKYGKTTFDNKLTKQLNQHNFPIYRFQSQSKYEQFFKILKQHVKLDVKKQNQYDIDSLIKNQNLKQLDNLIQKRVITNDKIQQILDLYIQNNKLDYIINIKDSYPNLNKNIKDKINQYLGDNL